MTDLHDLDADIYDALRRIRDAWMRLSARALHHESAQAHGPGSTHQPVSGGGISTPSEDAGLQGVRPDRGIVTLGEQVAEQVANVAGRLEGVLEERERRVRPSRRCWCCRDRLASVLETMNDGGDGLCGMCDRYRTRNDGRRCGPEQHQAWGREGSHVDAGSLCECRDPDHSHPPGGCMEQSADDRRNCWRCVNAGRDDRNSDAA